MGFLLSQVANGGGLEALLVDSAGRVINRTYGERVANHEVSHPVEKYYFSGTL